MKVLLSTTQLRNFYPHELKLQSFALEPVGYARLRSMLRLIGAARRADAFIALSPTAYHMLVAYACKLLLSKTVVVFFDIVLQKPTNLRSRLKAVIQKHLLRSVDVFLFVHRDYREYVRLFGIEHSRIRYVPFKANNFEVLGSIEVRDERYVLSCGASFRDYDCLIEAARRLPDVKFVILKPGADFSARHRMTLTSTVFPANVVIETDDMSPESWNRYIANATMVVIPIKPDCIQPAGVSTYLESMALGKPVVISRGPSTEGILDEDLALLYSPGDSNELASSIGLLWRDPAMREKIGSAGRRYALSLEGRDRLVRDLQRHVIEAISGTSTV